MGWPEFIATLGLGGLISAIAFGIKAWASGYKARGAAGLLASKSRAEERIIKARAKLAEAEAEREDTARHHVLTQKELEEARMASEESANATVKQVREWIAEVEKKYTERLVLCETKHAECEARSDACERRSLAQQRDIDELRKLMGLMV